MSGDLPMWAEMLTALLLVLGGATALVGTLGLWRFKDFYQRMHGPALVNTLATGLILLASMVFFSVLEQRVVWHEMLIAVFVALTVPVTTILLSRASLYRHRRAGRNPAGAKPSRDGDDAPAQDDSPTT